MKVLYVILSILGSVSLFLYGMKLMSEGIQKVTSVKLRSILSALTNNKFKGILTGFTITSLIQSSSATTVMVVSFVNAGILSLRESLSIIMGSNIGTTITAWLVFLFGFRFNITSLALPLIGITFVFLFSPNSNQQRWGQSIMGFAIIFIGLDFLKQAVPDISKSNEILEFFGQFSNFGFGSILIFFILGAVFTAIIQSSSAAMALTLVLADHGWFNFELATAIILGENLGTTITANIAAIFTNASAKKAARSHFIINLLGATWILILFQPVVQLIDWFTIKISGESPYNSLVILPMSLAIFHTAFNTFNIILLAPFYKFIIHLSAKLIRESNNSDETFSIQFINTGLLSTSELSILQARKKLALYSKEVSKMFHTVRMLFNEINDEKFYKLYLNIKEYERVCDRNELEMTNYLTKLSESDLSIPGSKRVRSMLKIIDEVEAIADICNKMAKTLNKKKKEKIWFTQDLRNNLNEMFNLVSEALDIMLNNLSKLYENITTTEATLAEKKINKYRKKLRKNHMNNPEHQIYTYKAGIIYTDIYSLCEQIGDHAMNVSQTIDESNR